MRHVDACLPCSKLVADDVTCFEPEAGAYLVKGLNFHKFYFNGGGSASIQLVGDVNDYCCYYCRLIKINSEHDPPSSSGAYAW